MIADVAGREATAPCVAAALATTSQQMSRSPEAKDASERGEGCAAERRLFGNSDHDNKTILLTNQGMGWCTNGGVAQAGMGEAGCGRPEQGRGNRWGSSRLERLR